MDNAGSVRPFPRLPSGVKGLDTLIDGGLLKGGVYLIMGPPGSGKTILANQMGFFHAGKGGRAVYVTLLAESHGRMLGNLQPMSWFDESVIASGLNYFGAYQTLANEGLDGLLRLLGEIVRRHKATMLFVDGVASAEELSGSPSTFKKFVHDLNTVASTSGCTSFLLSSLDGSKVHPEHTMVDGIVSLTMQAQGMRTYRELEIVKFRGSDHLLGRHFFRITGEGVRVFPRLESLQRKLDGDEMTLGPRTTFGVAALDDMLGGGVFGGSITSIVGPAGTGKTTLGVSFLTRGAELDEPGLLFSFYETPPRLMRKMEGVGQRLKDHVNVGKIVLQWQTPLERYIDELCEQLLELVTERGIKRLVLDGIAGMRGGLAEPTRLQHAMTALSNELRARGVATIFTEETLLFTKELRAPVSDFSAITDNMLLLHHVEVESELRRFLTVLKTRESYSDAHIHEFFITAKGVSVGQRFSDLELLMSGAARHRPPPSTRKRRRTVRAPRPTKRK